MSNSYTQKQKQLIEQIKNKQASEPSVHEIRKDYKDDDRICLASVVFPSPEITQIILEKVTNPLKDIEPKHFYYPKNQLHISIKNIKKLNKPPSFTGEDVKKVDKLFQEIVPQFPIFKLSLEDVITFSSGISVIGFSDKTLGRLVQALDKGLKDIGIPDDKKYFSDLVFFGNMTICRFTHEPSQTLLNKVKKLENKFIAEVAVKEITLLTCNYTCNPRTRKVIGTYKLK